MGEVALIWFYEAGFRSGEALRFFETVEEAEKYKNENELREGMINPTIFKKVNK